MNTQFFTGAGDNGNVHFSNINKKKSDICFHALGLCDEVNVLTGYAMLIASKDIQLHISRIQEMLFIAQAEIAVSIFGGNRNTNIQEKHIHELEDMIMWCDQKIPQIKTFIIPRGNESSMRLEIVRVRSREFERVLVEMGETYEISPELKIFANRLSSVCFAFARYENHIHGIKEVGPQYQ